MDSIIITLSAKHLWQPNVSSPQICNDMVEAFVAGRYLAVRRLLEPAGRTNDLLNAFWLTLRGSVHFAASCAPVARRLSRLAVPKASDDDPLSLRVLSRCHQRIALPLKRRCYPAQQ